jgi:phytoene dehydrogenase-like protein
LNPKIIRDLDLAAYGLRIIERPISNFLPLEDGRFLKVGGGQTKQQVAKFSQRDADSLSDYQARLDAVADVLRATMLETPPNVVEGSPFAAITELIKAGRIGNRIRALGLDLQRDFLDLFTASAGDFLDAWFESAGQQPVELTATRLVMNRKFRGSRSLSSLFPPRPELL